MHTNVSVNRRVQDATSSPEAAQKSNQEQPTEVNPLSRGANSAALLRFPMDRLRSGLQLPGRARDSVVGCGAPQRGPRPESFSRKRPLIRNCPPVVYRKAWDEAGGKVQRVRCRRTH